MPIFFFADIISASAGSSYDSQSPINPIRFHQDHKNYYQYVSMDKLPPMVLRGSAAN